MTTIPINSLLFVDVSYFNNISIISCVFRLTFNGLVAMRTAGEQFNCD